MSQDEDASSSSSSSSSSGSHSTGSSTDNICYRFVLEDVLRNNLLAPSSLRTAVKANTAELIGRDDYTPPQTDTGYSDSPRQEVTGRSAPDVVWIPVCAIGKDPGGEFTDWFCVSEASKLKFTGNLNSIYRLN